MNKLPLLFLALVSLFNVPVIAQKKLKKSDRTIVANIQNHVTFLNNQSPEGRKAGTEGEKKADEYIVKQFTKSGLKPHGENGWYQSFTIYDGKEVKPSTRLSINDEALTPYTDFFPL